jgi:hypothetical protein
VGNLILRGTRSRTGSFAQEQIAVFGLENLREGLALTKQVDRLKVCLYLQKADW